jgi:hypothetical protein
MVKSIMHGLERAFEIGAESAFPGPMNCPASRWTISDVPEVRQISSYGGFGEENRFRSLHAGMNAFELRKARTSVHSIQAS